MSKNNLYMRGFGSIEVFDGQGKLKHREDFVNVVPDVGEQHVADQLRAVPGQLAMTHMAIGESGTAGAEGDTLLGAEVQRVILDSGFATVGSAADFVRYRATFNIGATFTIEEDGIFNTSAGTDGVLLARGVFNTVSVSDGDTLIVTHNIQVT